MQSLNSQVHEVTMAIPRGLAIRGVIAIAFGVLILVNPSVSLSTLVLIIGAFATVDGVISLVATDAVKPSITGSATVNVTALAASHLAVSVPPTATAGVAFNAVVTAQDQFGD